MKINSRTQIANLSISDVTVRQVNGTWMVQESYINGEIHFVPLPLGTSIVVVKGMLVANLDTLRTKYPARDVFLNFGAIDL